MFPTPIQKLIQHFQKLPGIGPRQAVKFALRLTKMSEGELKNMAEDMASLKSSIGECRQCFLLFDRPSKPENVGQQQNNASYLCQFCRDIKRDHNKICAVATDHDALTIEKTKTFGGLYHILGGNISPLDKSNDHRPNLAALKNRALANPQEKEIILALNANIEGQATALYLEKLLAETGAKITRLAHGLSTGSEIEYADDETLINALKHRR